MSAQENTVITVRRSGGSKKLTARVVDMALAREKRYRIADTEVRGLYLSVEPSGAKSFLVRGRIGKGRGARTVDITIGSTDTVRLAEVRDTALGHLADLRTGQDPRRKSEAPRADASVTAYTQSLVDRGVETASQIDMVLKRAITGIRTAPIDEITRKDLVAIIDRISKYVGPVAGQTTQARLAAWMNWAVNGGDIQASPLAGYRRDRKTRSARAKELWTLKPNQIGRLWKAAASVKSNSYRDLLRFLILSGQRRTETSLICWADIDLAARVWHIPAAIRKTGVSHYAPLSDLAVGIIEAQPRDGDLVFPGRGGVPMAGWSKRLKPVKIAYGDDRVAHHGLRRGYRSGIAELGVRTEVAELMIGHARGGLIGLYDKSELWGERVEAQRKWETFVAEAVA